jgi:hypothetical protein
MTNPRTPRLMAAGAIGDLLEWYDFAVYGYFAAAIGRAYSPAFMIMAAAAISFLVLLLVRGKRET